MYPVILHDYYQGSLAKLEKDVKNTYKNELTEQCKREQKLSKNSSISIYQIDFWDFSIFLLEKSRLDASYTYRDINMYSEAASFGTPSCAKLERLIENLDQSNWISNILSFFPFYSLHLYRGFV